MKNTLMFKRFLMVVIPLALAAPAWATGCPASPMALSAIPVTPPNGCFAGNDLFSNFVVTSSIAPDTIINGVTLAPTTWLTPPDNTTIDLNAAAGGGIALTSSNPLGTAFCGTPTANITPKTFCIGGAPFALDSVITYDVHAVVGSISQLELDGTVVSHSSGASGATAVVFREFCLGTTTFSQGCSNYGVLQIGAVKGKFTTLSQSASQVFGGVTDIAIRDTVYLQTFGPTGEWAGVTDFELFTPEPATFGLVGLALAGLGALRFRKRKV